MNSRWGAQADNSRGRSYAARFDQLAASGRDVHGEASFCSRVAPAGARVLDAGCGTGRVAIRLAELGYDCAGVDLDEGMLHVARERAPQLPWLTADLAAPELPDMLGRGSYDLVVAAGNVIPLVAQDAEAAVIANLARLLSAGGLLVAGFGLDRTHLPPMAAVVELASYDAWCADAGLVLRDRYSTWEGDAYRGGGYAVSVHGRTGG